MAGPRSGPTPFDTASRKGDYSASKAQARANENSQRQRYEGQMRSEGLDPASGKRLNPPVYQTAPLKVHKAIQGGGGGTIAGAMLGALAFFTLRAYVENRWTGVKAFYAAKFLNHTSALPNPVPLSASSGSSATTTPAPAQTSTKSPPSTPSSVSVAAV